MVSDNIENTSTPSENTALFAVIIAAEGTICGVGTSEKHAWIAAEETARFAVEEGDGDLDDDIIYDIKPISPALYRKVLAEGGDTSYEIRHGVLVTEDEAKSPKLHIVRMPGEM